MNYKLVIICLFFLACNRKQFTNPNDLINTPPPPKLTYPIEDTLLYCNPSHFDWEAIDDDTLYPSGRVYEILYSSDSSFTSPTSVITNSSYVYPSTLFKEHCFWKVRARREEASEKSWGEWSNVASFRERFSLTAEYAGIPGGDQIIIKDNYAYINSYHQNSFYILNLSNPISPTLISFFTDSSVNYFYGMEKSGDYLFLLAIDDSAHYVIRTYSITTPSSPKFLGTCRLGNYNNYNVIAVSYPAVYIKTSPYCVSIINTSQIENPFVTDSIECKDYSINNITIFGKYLLLSSSSKIYVYDISDPFHPSIANSYNCISSTYVLCISGDTLFTANNSTITIFDISVLPTINKLGTISTSPYSFTNLSLYSNNCFVSHSGYILELNGVNNPLIGWVCPSFSIYDIAANKDYLYLLSPSDGISIIKLCKEE
ncbi:MAG: hypothetical protein PHE49_05620 [bacterium]|nr:hypothetical protein [bacterium]